MALAGAMNDALWTDWRLVAVIAVVRDFLFRVISAKLSHVAVRLIHH